MSLGHYLTGGRWYNKQIAHRLDIFPRTLEKNLENAKGKIGIKTRSEFFDILIPYQDLFKGEIN